MKRSYDITILHPLVSLYQICSNYAPPHGIIERASHRGGSVMVWAGESLHHKTNIVSIKGNL